MGDFDLTGLDNSISPSEVRGQTLGQIITTIINALFPLLGIVLLLYLVSGGLQLMTSKGDPKGVEAAKQKITNALVGIIIVFLSYYLVQLVLVFFGLKTQAGGIFGL